MTPFLRSKPKVLLVDSNAVNLNSLTCLLNEFDCEIYKAPNGIEAFEIVLKYKIDIILSDLFLPLMDGTSLVKEFRKLHYGRNAIFLFVTSSLSEESQIKCIQDGADDVIVRPINSNVFKAKMGGLLNRISDSQIGKKSFLRNTLNDDMGGILYCRNGKSKNLPQSILLSTIDVERFEDFTEVVDSQNVWMILVDDKALWAKSSIHKMKQKVGNVIPIWLLASKSCPEKEQSQFISNGGFGILQKFRSPEILSKQINELINREVSIKSQYTNSIKQAVQTSPVHFLSEYEEDFKSFMLKVRYEPFTKPAGGDFYEVTKFPNGNILLLLGDVMGKRWGAWFFANAYLAYIRASLKVFPTKRQYEISNNLGYLVSEINQFLYKDIQLSDAFTTLTAVLVIPSERKFKIASAGAIPPYLFRQSEKAGEFLPVTGKILGIVEEEEYLSTEHTFEKGDKLIIMTDGYPEAFDNTQNHIVGLSKISETLQQSLRKGITEPKKLENAIITSNNIDGFNDDRTMMLIDFK